MQLTQAQPHVMYDVHHWLVSFPYFFFFYKSYLRTGHGSMCLYIYTPNIGFTDLTYMYVIFMQFFVFFTIVTIILIKNNNFIILNVIIFILSMLSLLKHYYHLLNYIVLHLYYYQNHYFMMIDTLHVFPKFCLWLRIVIACGWELLYLLKINQ